MLQSAVDARGEDEHLEPVIDTGIEDEPDEPEMGVVKTIGYEFDYPVGHSQTPGVTPNSYHLFTFHCRFTRFVLARYRTCQKSPLFYSAFSAPQRSDGSTNGGALRC